MKGEGDLRNGITVGLCKTVSPGEEPLHFIRAPA